jgi:hypothetical protein
MRGPVGIGRRVGRWPKRGLYLLLLVLALGSAGVGAGGSSPEGVQLTPIVLHVARPPIPVLGSDGRYHVVYELEVTNMTRRPATIKQVDVLDAASGNIVQSLDADAVAGRLVVRQADPTPATLGPSQFGILYLHLALTTKREITFRLAHRLLVGADAIGPTPLRETGGQTRLAPATDLVLSPPLRGARFIAGDGCCDTIRHIRATLPLNGRLFTAQRFAIDWERLDDEYRIFVGDRANPASYVIYGAPVLAVAHARVIAAVDGLPDSPTGSLPSNIPIDQTDGNHVILDLGDGRFALYAHLKPGSVRVRPGQRVRRGHVLGLVGTSGNSSEPHLHFRVMDGPSALASNGVPYVIRSFRSTERGVSTEAFDRAIETGQPLDVGPIGGPPTRKRSLPLDLWIVEFD